jgi:dihydrofolate reductase
MEIDERPVCPQLPVMNSGTTGIDDDFAARGFDTVVAWIMGRNMFSPVRGSWPDDEWKGWWGENPPFPTPVFVLTHHARAPLSMAGKTEFHFVTGGVDAALQHDAEAANGKDIRIGGGVATILVLGRQGYETAVRGKNGFEHDLRLPVSLLGHCGVPLPNWVRRSI